MASGYIMRGNPHATSGFDLYVMHEKPFRQRVQKSSAGAGVFRQRAAKQPAGHGLATLVEDAADTLVADKITSRYILDQAIGQFVEFVFAVYQQPLPRTKDRLKGLCELDATVGLGVQRYY